MYQEAVANQSEARRREAAIKKLTRKEKLEVNMGVEKIEEKYRCNVCGNEITVTKVGGGELVCCKQPMEKIAG